MRSLFYSPQGVRDSLGLFVLRLVVGVAFLFHGWGKVQNPTGWMGPKSSIAPAMQAAAAVSEFGGGIALVTGFLTRLGALGIAGVMIGALAIVHLPAGDPFVGKPGGSSYEPAAFYLACAILFVLSGPGRFSLDWLLFGRTRDLEAL